MTTAITVVNNALRELGGDPISAFDEGTGLANACADLYATKRDAVLRSHAWNFATFHAELSPLADGTGEAIAPAYTWAYQFLQPTDPYCLRVLSVENAVPFRLAMRKTLDGMQRVIWCDSTPLRIEYLGRVEVLDYWDAQAIDALQGAMKAALALVVTGQATKKELANEEAVFLLSEARRSDGQEGTPQRVRLPGGLYHARLRGSRLFIREGREPGESVS